MVHTGPDTAMWLVALGDVWGHNSNRCQVHSGTHAGLKNNNQAHPQPTAGMRSHGNKNNCNHFTPNSSLTGFAPHMRRELPPALVSSSERQECPEGAHHRMHVTHSHNRLPFRERLYRMIAVHTDCFAQWVSPSARLEQCCALHGTHEPAAVALSSCCCSKQSMLRWHPNRHCFDATVKPYAYFSTCIMQLAAAVAIT